MHEHEHSQIMYNACTCSSLSVRWQVELGGLVTTVAVVALDMNTGYEHRVEKHL